MSEFTSNDVEQNVARVVAILTPRWARHMAARYNSAVYLLGSILHNPLNRDIDIRIPVEDNYFAARYGNTLHRNEVPKKGTYYDGRLESCSMVHWDEDGPTQRWIDDIAKTNEALSKQLNHLVDLQIWPLSYWRTGTYPTPLLLAEPTPRFWVYSKFCPDPSAPSVGATPLPEPTYRWRHVLEVQWTHGESVPDFGSMREEYEIERVHFEGADAMTESIAPPKLTNKELQEAYDNMPTDDCGFTSLTVLKAVEAAVHAKVLPYFAQREREAKAS